MSQKQRTAPRAAAALCFGFPACPHHTHSLGPSSAFPCSTSPRNKGPARGAPAQRLLGIILEVYWTGALLAPQGGREPRPCASVTRRTGSDAPGPAPVEPSRPLQRGCEVLPFCLGSTSLLLCMGTHGCTACGAGESGPQQADVLNKKVPLFFPLPFLNSIHLPSVAKTPGYEPLGGMMVCFGGVCWESVWSECRTARPLDPLWEGDSWESQGFADRKH